MIARGKEMLKYHIDEALEQINQSEHGAHHLIVYPNQRVLRELYTKYVKTQLEDGNKTVLILPYYETTESLRNLLLDDSLPAYMVKKIQGFTYSNGFYKWTFWCK